MKFIVSSNTLLKQLQAISGALNNNNTLPILDNFLFEVKDQTLTASASDLETTMTTRINLEKGDDGSVAVPARLLLDTLKTFPDQPLTFDVDSGNFGIEIHSDNGKYKLSGQNGEEFPKIPALDNPSTMDMEAGTLFNAINKTIFATINDELRPVMAGVYLQLSKEGCTFVATDAHKLVRYIRTDTKSDREAAFILPKKPLTLLKSLLSGIEAPVKIEYNDTNAFFQVEEVSMICRLIDGKYPNYEAVIPKENNKRMTIDRMSLLSSIKRVSIFSNKTTYQVRMKIAGSELNISAEDLDYANEAKERLGCQYEGEDIEIGFNSRFLLEMLTNLESDEVILEMSTPNRAGILLPASGDDEHENVLMLVMPVMLNS